MVMIPDIESPPWFLLGVFVAVALGLVVWFRIYYWLRDRARRLGYWTPIPQTRNRRALVICGIVFLAALICTFGRLSRAILGLSIPLRFSWSCSRLFASAAPWSVLPGRSIYGDTAPGKVMTPPYPPLGRSETRTIQRPSKEHEMGFSRPSTVLVNAFVRIGLALSILVALVLASTAVKIWPKDYLWVTRENARMPVWVRDATVGETS